MKTFKIIPVVLILIGVLLNACAASAPTTQPAPSSGGGDKPLLSEVVFTGTIQGMDGDQWVISGQTVKVDPSVVTAGPFVIGDTVKVEALVAGDGSMTAQRVESPSAADLAQTAVSTPAAAFTQVALVFDDSGTEAIGTVEAITDSSITLGGQTFNFAPGAEIKGLITVGALVKLHFIVNADGSLSVREIELTDLTQFGNDNGSDDNSNANINDDNSNDDNSNDDNSNDSNTNDDNSNDDNDDDSNDDNGGNSNDNDDDDDDDSNDSNDNG